MLIVQGQALALGDGHVVLVLATYVDVVPVHRLGLLNKGCSRAAPDRTELEGVPGAGARSPLDATYMCYVDAIQIRVYRAVSGPR